ncbi:thiamine diphosphokinase [Lacticaseibacillus yichunensis]|uniref:Thiamine diphosphokinase n=1 Tax=Lacticaseibacillus yichunensis TaxID=2486015 RepID=A0ABW4CRQ7_9LACO|nr:thiamine diphosphokinase [Lacticaseibacillus yichunensis]
MENSLLGLMVGGPRGLLPADWPSLAPTWAGVDRGTLTLLEAGVAPAFAVGDFDSQTAAEYAKVRAAVADVARVAPEKDETDTEMGLRVAFEQSHATRVLVLGGTGGRLDHLLSNLWLLTQPRFESYAERVSFVDQQNWIDFLLPGAHLLQPRPQFRYLGIANLTAVRSLTITGAKYALPAWTNGRPFSWASNEFLGEAPVRVSFSEGVVAVIRSRDRVGQTRDN